MWEVLRRRCFWWVCLAAGTTLAAARVLPGNVEECKVLSFKKEPTHHRLPTNLTIKPSSASWNLTFTLSNGESPPAACLKLQETHSWVSLVLSSGDCGPGKSIERLQKPILLNTWTTISVNMTGDKVYLQESEGESYELTAKDVTLPLDGLQLSVIKAWGVEVAVGCAVSCPVQRYVTAGHGIQKKVYDLEQENLNFYFRPESSSSWLKYELKCMTQSGDETRIERDVRQKDSTRQWQFVELQKQEHKATVRLNSKPLEDILLPEPCTWSTHVVWTTGNGSFSFSCNPRGVEKEDKVVEHVGRPIWLVVPIVSILCVVSIVIICLLYRKYGSLLKTKPINSSQRRPMSQFYLKLTGHSQSETVCEEQNNNSPKQKKRVRKRRSMTYPSRHGRIPENIG